VYTKLSVKQVFENATIDRKSPCRSAVNSATCALRLQLPLTVPGPRSEPCDARFTGWRLGQLSNIRKSATIEKMTHIDNNDFDHKDTGYHLLQ
jgi:hypothetical protein